MNQISVFLLLLSAILAESTASDCYTVSDTGTVYRGHANSTVRGACLSWTTNVPASSGVSIDALRAYLNSTEGTDDHNFCRSFPSELVDDSRPWCYVQGALQSTSSMSERWEYCSDLQQCETCYRPSVLYRGAVSQTLNGQTCLFWNQSIVDPQGKLTAIRAELRVADGFIEHNYCRNPQAVNDNVPWCYTAAALVANSSLSRWEYCAVPRCDQSTSAQPTQPTIPPTSATSSPTSRTTTSTTRPPVTTRTTAVWPPTTTRASVQRMCDLSDTDRQTQLGADCTGLPNTQCSFQCKSPAQPTVSVVTCSLSGRWEPALYTVCQTKCDTNLPNGQMALTCRGQAGESCEFACSYGSRLPPTKLICLDNGQWNWNLSMVCAARSPNEMSANVSVDNDGARSIIIAVVVSCSVLILIIAVLAFLFYRFAVAKRRAIGQGAKIAYNINTSGGHLVFENQSTPSGSVPRQSAQSNEGFDDEQALSPPRYSVLTNQKSFSAIP